MVRFYIRMKPGFDTLELWKKIEPYKINLTDTGESVWCYGATEYADYIKILYECRLLATGTIEISLEGGDSVARGTPVNNKVLNCHHLLWGKQMYSQGYCHALREHPWLRIYMPRDTLHRYIHHSMTCIPVPDGKDARKTFEYLMRLERAGKLDYNANIFERLDFLIDQLKTPSTVEALQKQRQIVLNFYEPSE